jgi:hypothetical protein
MKKFAPILAIAVLGVMFTSCKKDYTCSCSYNLAGTPLSQDYALGKQKKGDAKSACDTYQTNFNNNVAGAASVSCSLK